MHLENSYFQNLEDSANIFTDKLVCETEVSDEATHDSQLNMEVLKEVDEGVQDIIMDEYIPQDTLKDAINNGSDNPSRKQWIPADPLKDKVFYAAVTYVDYDCNVYFCPDYNST